MGNEYIHRSWFIFGIVCMGLTGLLCGLLAGYGYGYKAGKDSVIGGSVVSVDTVHDTVMVRMPIAMDSVQTGVIKVPVVLPMEPTVPKAEVKVTEPDSLFSYCAEGGAARDLCNDKAQKGANFARKDTVWVTLPRTQKKYEDSTYVAWVSGYQPRLDSIRTYLRTVTITRVQTVTKRNAFGAGIVGGAGYGVFSRKPDVWIGVGGFIKIL